jgi:hypothetical protein
MTQIATTIEQSKRLLELGLDPKTADMVWVRYAAGGYRLEVLHRELFERIMETDIAAWSLSALFDVMPKELVNDDYNKKGEKVVAFAKLVIDTFVVDGRYIWRVGYKGKRRYWVKCYSDDPIRSTLDMIGFLIRQGYIKKGGAS